MMLHLMLGLGSAACAACLRLARITAKGFNIPYLSALSILRSGHD
jgi:hypothetical protein